MLIRMRLWRTCSVNVVAVALTGLLSIDFCHAAQERKGDGAMPEHKTIVVIGASYAEGWKSQPIAGFRFINKGITGQQSFEMLARFQTDVIDAKPHAVIIWGFINDIFRSDRERIDQTLTRTQESLMAMIRAAKTANVTPILATEVTIRGKDEWRETVAGLIGGFLGKTSYHEYVNGHVMRINRWIRETSSREGVLLLDFEAALSDDHGLRRKDFAQPDGSHISTQGYEALSQLAEARLPSVYLRP